MVMRWLVLFLPLFRLAAHDPLDFDPGRTLEKSRPPELSQDEAPTIDRTVRRLGDAPLMGFFKGAYGFRPKLGRPIPTSGFAGGVEFGAGDLLTGQAIVRASARASVNRYLHADAEFALPRMARGVLFANILATYRNFPQLRYYGSGPSSSASSPAAFRLEDTTGEATAGVRPWRILRGGATAGYVRINTGPGTHARFFSLERQFLPSSTPGLDRQTDYATAGAFAEIDYTSQRDSPRSGGIYSARLTNYVDQHFGRYSYRGLDLDFRQYIPLFHEQRVFALRARGSFTDTRSNQIVPFYRQPTLGGPELLRAFPAFRFYDNNSMVFNAEYRWKVSTGMELALFSDAGKVFPDHRQLNLRGLQFAYGAGVRFNYRQNTFLRLDGACGREGCQIWLRFHDNY